MVDQELELQEKKEQREDEGEKTEMVRYFVPETDICETAEALSVTMDIPGVSTENIDINLDKNTLTVTGKIDFDTFKEFKPIYTEYNVGNYSRSFTLSSQIDKEGISAMIENGVLSLKLPKAKEATARRIEVNKAES